MKPFIAFFFLMIGIAGSSAGGHLAATAGTRFDDGDVKAVNPVESD
jgi:acetyl esterase/lipase